MTEETNLETFKQCGWPAYALLFASLTALLVSVAALVAAFAKPASGKLVGPVALVGALMVMGIGLFGTHSGRSRMDAVLAQPHAGLSPSQLERIREQGYVEAGTCTTLGLDFGALPLLLSVIATGIALARAGKVRPELPR